MKRSTGRILTTHVGSLARPPRQLELLFAKERGEPYDQSDYESSTRQAVDDIVAGQVEAGIDIVCDGEQGKSSFLTYITERLDGFSPCEKQGEDLWVDSRETLAFPEFYETHRKAREGLIAQPVKLTCTGTINYVGGEILKDVTLPEGKIVMPGVISHSTPLVEHPELIAQRLIRFASVAGKENVMGGSDCGFASFAATEQEIHPSIVWAKFANLAEGARIASAELW